jgi:hypothetical protein
MGNTGRNRWEGTISLVTVVALDACPAELQGSALEAAWQWTFSPMLVDGQPQMATLLLAIVYRLSPSRGPCWF